MSKTKPEKSPLEQVLEILAQSQNSKPVPSKPKPQGNLGAVQFLLIFLIALAFVIVTS